MPSHDIYTRSSHRWCPCRKKRSSTPEARFSRSSCTPLDSAPRVWPLCREPCVSFVCSSRPADATLWAFSWGLWQWYFLCSHSVLSQLYPKRPMPPLSVISARIQITLSRFLYFRSSMAAARLGSQFTFLPTVPPFALQSTTYLTTCE